jgi:hypothetical protein
MGNSSPVAGSYAPDWKRDKNTQIESYLTRRPGDPGYLLSMISHEETTKDVPVSIDLDSLELDRKGTIVVWDHVVADATRFKGRVTERIVKSVYAQSGWQLDRVTRRRLLYIGPYRSTLELNLSMEPLILHQLYVTDERAGIYAVDNMPANYLFSKTSDVKVQTTGQATPNVLQLKVASERERAEIIAYLEREKTLVRATSDGEEVAPVWVEEGGLACPVFTVGKGRHLLEMQCTSARSSGAQLSDMETDVGPDALSIRIPGLQRAVISVAKDDDVFFSRMVVGDSGTFTVPLASDRVGGTYHVRTAFGMTADGAWWRGKPLGCSVQIPASSVDLGLSPKSGEVIPELRKIVSVDKTIRGVHVLRTATYTSATTLAGWQPKLKALTASVNADTLTLEAGTTRKIMSFLGAAFAGIEARNLRRVKLRLDNTYHNAFHGRGPGNHGPMYWPSSRSFAGFVVDYHTPRGYTKRVNLAVGLLHPQCNTHLPRYGKNGTFDEMCDLGSVVDQGPHSTFSLDLARYAPDDWDGQVWFSVGSDWAGSDRRLKARILATNDFVTDGFLPGSSASRSEF